MKSRVMVAEDLDFEFVQRFDDDGRENAISSLIPPRTLSALITAAAGAPSRDEVLPVTIVPSGSSIAAAAAVASAFACAADNFCPLRKLLPESL